MRKVKKKALVLSMALAAGLLVPATMNAQSDGSRGIFDRGFEATESTRDGETSFTVNTQDFESPLGSGIVILLAAGAGYAALKRKEERQ